MVDQPTMKGQSWNRIVAGVTLLDKEFGDAGVGPGRFSRALQGKKVQDLAAQAHIGRKALGHRWIFGQEDPKEEGACYGGGLSVGVSVSEIASPSSVTFFAMPQKVLSASTRSAQDAPRCAWSPPAVEAK